MTRGRGPRASGVPAGSAHAGRAGGEEIGRGSHGVENWTRCLQSRWQMVSPGGFGTKPIHHSWGKEDPPDSWKGMLRRGFLGPRWERRLPSRASVFGFKFTASLLLGWQTAEVWGQGRKGSGHARFLPCQLCRCLPGAPLSSGRVSKQGGGLQRHSSRNAVIDTHCWTAVLGWTKPVSKVFERTGCGPGAGSVSPLYRVRASLGCTLIGFQRGKPGGGKRLCSGHWPTLPTLVKC